MVIPDPKWICFKSCVNATDTSLPIYGLFLQSTSSRFDSSNQRSFWLDLLSPPQVSCDVDLKMSSSSNGRTIWEWFTDLRSCPVTSTYKIYWHAACSLRSAWLVCASSTDHLQKDLHVTYPQGKAVNHGQQRFRKPLFVVVAQR